MWVTYDNFWLFYAGTFTLILFLYVMKALLLRPRYSDKEALTIFFLAVALCVPFTWALSPDWKNIHVSRFSNYVGSPIMTFTVPCVSFLIDLARRSAGHHGGWLWRVPLELLIAVPLWFYCWVFMELMLGWIWI
jgi:hypothetical protein